MTEATDEDVAQAKRSLEAGHPLPIGLQAKLLARLERVERALRVMQCGAQEARSLNKQPG